ASRIELFVLSILPASRGTCRVKPPTTRYPAAISGSENAKSEQRGHMMLCIGVVAAWRNPRAHKLVKDDPDKTIMMLEVVQHLMQVTRTATRTKAKKQ
ncbi:MAG: TIGR02391 family protein, partial [Candidatus Microthrix parvicella]